MTTIAITDCDFGRGEIEQEVLGREHEIIFIGSRDGDVIAEQAAGAAGMFVQWAPVTDSLLSRLPALRAVVRYGMGLDNVDLGAAERHGVTVLNVDDYCIDEVASHAVALVVAAARSTWQFDRAVKAGRWGPEAAPQPVATADDRVGVVGLGRIGSEVARRLGELGHPVAYWDPGVPQSATTATKVDSLSELATIVNHLTLHVPLTPDTTGLIDGEVLRALGPAGHLVNTGRGGLVDEQALLALLGEGLVGRASLDVLDVEPPRPGSTSDELRRHVRVLVTPHVAYLSTQSLDRLRARAAERLSSVLS